MPVISENVSEYLVEHSLYVRLQYARDYSYYLNLSLAELVTLAQDASAGRRRLNNEIADEIVQHTLEKLADTFLEQFSQHALQQSFDRAVFEQGTEDDRIAETIRTLSVTCPAIYTLGRWQRKLSALPSDALIAYIVTEFEAGRDDTT